MNRPLCVTQPDLPPLDDFLPLLRQIWDSRVLTNGGPFHEQFEQSLCEYLGVKHISLFTNGTIALVAALQALRITLLLRRIRSIAAVACHKTYLPQHCYKALSSDFIMRQRAVSS